MQVQVLGPGDMRTELQQLKALLLIDTCSIFGLNSNNRVGLLYNFTTSYDCASTESLAS